MGLPRCDSSRDLLRLQCGVTALGCGCPNVCVRWSAMPARLEADPAPETGLSPSRGAASRQGPARKDRPGQGGPQRLLASTARWDDQAVGARGSGTAPSDAAVIRFLPMGGSRDHRHAHVGRNEQPLRAAPGAVAVNVAKRAGEELSLAASAGLEPDDHHCSLSDRRGTVLRDCAFRQDCAWTSCRRTPASPSTGTAP